MGNISKYYYVFCLTTSRKHTMFSYMCGLKSASEFIVFSWPSHKHIYVTTVFLVNPSFYNDAVKCLSLKIEKDGKLDG